MMRCASCGKSEDERGKLKTCTACKSVQYCNIACQRNHRKAHKKECKRIGKTLKALSRAEGAATGLEALSIPGEDVEKAEDDEDLFKHIPKGECPLCFVPLPNEPTEMSSETCCCKSICNGCNWKHKQVLHKMNLERALDDAPKPPLQLSCVFCRKAVPTSNEELIKRVENRMALGDSEAFDMMAGLYYLGNRGLARDDRRAFELYLRAAELGSASGCYNVSVLYRDGEGVDTDILKEEHYLKLAARRGHILARINLGILEYRRGNVGVAVRHWIISASAGDDDSLHNIGTAYRDKYATKDQYETAIRANKDAKEEMSSEERDKAKAAQDNGLL